MLVVTFGGNTDTSAGPRLPLLTLLLICEFAFFVTAIAAYVSLKQLIANGFSWSGMVVSILCVLSALTFLVKGYLLWPL